MRRHRDAFGDAPVYRTRARRRRRIRLSRARRGPCLDARHGRRRCSTPCAATRRTAIATSPGCSTSRKALQDDPRPVPHQDAPRSAARSPFRSTRSSRRRHRQALLDRRDVVRLDLARGARDAGHRDEPDRRQVEHRRGRRGVRSLQAAAERPLEALGDQAGRLRPLRRDGGISRQLRHDADQDGAGREARRRRSVARPQGRRGDRQACATRRRASA